MMVTLKKIWMWITGKQEIPPYPIPFALVVYTEEASEKGVKDNQNKQIILYFYNKLNNLQQEVFPYSEQRVYAMEKIRKIPVYDKTQNDERFPVWGKVLPQEVSYMTK